MSPRPTVRSPRSGSSSTGASRPSGASSPTARSRRPTPPTSATSPGRRSWDGWEIQARPPEESGTRGEVAYDLTALGGYEEIERFFGQVALSHRLIDVESLSLTTNPERMIQLAATLRLPFWPAAAPLPPPPEVDRDRSRGVPRPVLDTYRHDQARALAKTEAIASWRRARRNPRLFLSELAAVVRERPVVLAYASLGDTFTVRGLATGEGTIRRLESRFESGFFRVSEFLVAKQGACHRFEAHGTSPVAGPDAELPVPLEDPFVQDETPCRVDRDPADQIVVKGPTPTEKNPGDGPYTLRLRGLDFADVFQALSLVTGAGFVVDHDVVGRVDLDVTRLTLEEILELIRDETRVQVAGPGRVRRVSRSHPPSRGLTPRRGAGQLRPQAGGRSGAAGGDDRHRPRDGRPRAPRLPRSAERLGERSPAPRAAAGSGGRRRARRARRGGSSRSRARHRGR